MKLTLKDLEGRPGLTRAEFVSSRTAAMRAFRANKAVTSAGNTGAINIWRDRYRVGMLHASFSRNRLTHNHATMFTLADLNSWLKTWWPEIGRIDA